MNGTWAGADGGHGRGTDNVVVLGVVVVGGGLVNERGREGKITGMRLAGGQWWSCGDAVVG